MRKKRFIFSGVIVFILLLILFTICIEYKIEENRIKKTVDSGIVYINNKKVKLPISIKDFEKRFGKVSFKSELYDEDNYYYYDGKTKESNIMIPNIRIEGLLSTKNNSIGVFISNIKNTKQKVQNCYITGVRLNNDIKLFNNISLETDKKEIDKILYTGKLEAFKKEYNNLTTYNNYYVLEITYLDNDVTDIIYYFNYDECKEDGCSKFLN